MTDQDLAKLAASADFLAEAIESLTTRLARLEDEYTTHDQVLGKALSQIAALEFGPVVIKEKTVSMPPEIAAAIVGVMKGAKDPKKDSENKHGGYRYASVDAFWTALRPIMSEFGLYATLSEIEETRHVAESTDSRGNTKSTTWIRLKYQVALCHESGAVWTDPRPRTIMVIWAGPQSYGAAASYVEKQWLRSLFKLATGEPDADHGEGAEPPDNGKQTRKRGAERSTAKLPDFGPSESKGRAAVMLQELEGPMGSNDLQKWRQASTPDFQRLLDADKADVTKAIQAVENRILDAGLALDDAGPIPETFKR